MTGESEFKGRGVSYCGVCDSPFFRGKTVAVVGSGRDAVDDIGMLSETAAKVYAIPGKQGYSEDYSELKSLKGNVKVDFIYGTDISEIGGTDFVEYIKLNGAGPGEVKVDGVFVVLDHASISGVLDDLGLERDAGGCLIVDKHQKTSFPGVFAAGDCCCNGFQIVTATGMGAEAALSAMRYVKQMKSDKLG